MPGVKSFEELKVWQEARTLTKMIYKRTNTGQFMKDYGLRDQIRRASISIVSNIAEGYERGGDKEFVQFLSIAKGSCGEVRGQLYVALDQNYLSQPEFEAVKQQAVTVSRMLSRLIDYLKSSDLRGTKYKPMDHRPLPQP